MAATSEISRSSTLGQRSDGRPQAPPSSPAAHPRRGSSSVEITRHVADVHHRCLRERLDRLDLLFERIEARPAAERGDWSQISRLFAELKHELQQCVIREERIFPQIRQWELEGEQPASKPPPPELLQAAKALEKWHAWLLQRLWLVLRRARDASQLRPQDELASALVMELSALCDDYDQHLFEVECLLLPRIVAWKSVGGTLGKRCP